MLKSLLATLTLLMCSFIGLTSAYCEPTSDRLQAYRDEIKQSETNASQSVLDTLQADTESDSTAQQNQATAPSSGTMQTPRSSASNADKAFTPRDNPSANKNHSSNKNPWLQPNPWAKQPPNIWEKNAKINPYANAPIPGPTPPKASANGAIPSPPNIFSPSKATHTNNP